MRYAPVGMTKKKEGSREGRRSKAAKTEKLFEPKKALRAASDMYEELRMGRWLGCGWGCCMDG